MRNVNRLLALSALTLVLLAGCARPNVDLYHPLLRSPVIDSPEAEQQILAKAHVSKSADGRFYILHVQGTPYERGYQHGALLRAEVQDNLMAMYNALEKKFYSTEFFAEAYERARPFIPQTYIDEMHGLAHGARLPLHVVHAIHILPAVTEWGGRKQVRDTIKKIIAGELAMSCSNIGAAGPATADGSVYAVRVLDWGIYRISKAHEYPLITVGRGEDTIPFANIGWVGFLGAVSGMNAERITLGEMGYEDPDNETLKGLPMPFLLREVMARSRNLEQVRETISEAPGTNSFVFLMTDGKNGEREMYVRDPDRFLVCKPGVDVRDREDYYPAIEEITYGGRYGDKMTRLLNSKHGSLAPQVFMDEIIPQIAMKGNFHNVIYDPKNLRFWVNNAKSPSERAAEQPYFLFDFAAALEQFK